MLEGSEYELKPDELESYRMRLKGPMHMPGEVE